MKGNIIVALVVGAALGFVVGRATKGPSGPAPGGSAAVAQQGAPAAANPDVGKTPADLPPQYLKEADLPAGSLAGMTDAQKYAVLKVSNEKICDCGCDKGSVANCRKTDPNCPRSPQLLQQMIDLAKQGKSSAEIRTAVDKGGGDNKPKPSARPTEDPNAVYKIAVGDSPVKGPATAKVTIIEATDFQ